MKKVLISALAGLAMLATFVSCGTTKVEEKPQFENKQIRPTIIDQQNPLREQPPEWVMEVMDGKNDAEALAPYISGLENTLAFVSSVENTNLQFAEAWAREVDIKSTVASSIQDNISKAVEANLTGEGEGIEAETKQTIEQSVRNISNVTLKGLLEKARYWVKLQNFDIEGNPTNQTYRFFIVSAIDKEDFKNQLKEAMNLKNTATEADKCKAIINEAVKAQYGVELDWDNSTATPITEDAPFISASASKGDFAAELAIDSLE